MVDPRNPMARRIVLASLMVLSVNQRGAFRIRSWLRIRMIYENLPCSIGLADEMVHGLHAAR